VSIILSKFKDIILSSQEPLAPASFIHWPFQDNLNASQASISETPASFKNWRHFSLVGLLVLTLVMGIGERSF
jgi:hypothetical protein